MAQNAKYIQKTINKFIWAGPLEQGTRGRGRARFDLPDGCDLPGAFLRRSQTAWSYALWGEMCRINTSTLQPITKRPLPFTAEWWVSGRSSNTHLHGCAWLASSAFGGSEKCPCSNTFCHPIKHTALAYGLQFNKLYLHLKHTAWLVGNANYRSRYLLEGS